MILIKNGHLINPENGDEYEGNLLVGDDGRIAKISKEDIKVDDRCSVIDASNLIVTSGLVDAHVHFRDPGQTHKEDILTGAKAAAKGGFTSVIMMGNTIPRMDNADTIRYALKKGRTTGINVYCCANATKNMSGKEITDFDSLVEAGAVLFTDDGVPIRDANLMEEICVQVAKKNMVLSLHEENPEYIKENGINSGKIAENLGLTGSDRMAEISMVERDIEISRKTGANLTIQHISTKEAVDMIREARKEGVNIHAEATPHHFTLTQDAVLKYGTYAKMNPPLRLESDRQAIIEGLADGTIEMVATDHAPHSIEEKNQDFVKAPSGIIGLETSFSLGLRELVQKNHMSLATLLNRMSYGAANLYNLPAGKLREGESADLVIIDLNKEWVCDKFCSKACNSPFTGEVFPGVIMYTICNGKVVYKG